MCTNVNIQWTIRANSHIPQEVAAKFSFPRLLQTHTEKSTMKPDMPVTNVPRTTILHLNQHLQGKHGNGAITLCDIKYQWPDSKYRHQVDCDDCKKLKEKQNEKPEYPHKIIIRMRKPKKLVVKVQTSQLCCICCDQLIFSKQQIVSCKYVFDFF